MLTAIKAHGLCAILSSLVFLIVAIPTAALAGEIDVLQRQCERETEAWERKKRDATTPSCRRLEKFLRDKAYKDRYERPPKDEEHIFLWNKELGMSCLYKQSGEMVSCPYVPEIFLWNKELRIPCRHKQTGELISCP
ncbi:MAG: hypothetical protein FWH15_08940 [Betaproteobacteria bacterium]|nr:hypothetical protein [Betaproteobacteria bacterium]